MPPMSAVCLEFVDTLVSFLEACLHHLLCLRGVYPSSLFRRVRLFGQFVWWSHAKAVSSYIRELCLSLRESLRRRLLPSIRLVILDRNDALLEWFDFRFSSEPASAAFLSSPRFSVKLPGGQRDGEDGRRHSGGPAAAKSRELGFSHGGRTEKSVLHQDAKTGEKLENAQGGDADRHRRRRRCRDFMETTLEACSETGDDEDSERAKIPTRETRLACDKTRQENAFAEGRDSTGKKDAFFAFPSAPATLVDHCRDTLNRLEFSSFWIDDLCEDSETEEEGGRKTSDEAPRIRRMETQKAARSTSPGIRRVRGRRKACTFCVLVEVDQTVLSRFEARKNAASCSRRVPLAADEDLHAIQRLRCSWMPSFSFSSLSASSSSSACPGTVGSPVSAPSPTRPIDRLQERETAVLVSAFPFSFDSTENTYTSAASSLRDVSARGFLAVFAGVPARRKQDFSRSSVSKFPDGNCEKVCDIASASDAEEAVDKTEMEREDTREKKSEEAEEQRTGVVTDPWIAAAELVGFSREDRQ
ncbi:HORMA domain protein [Toxoplasma gondii GAB2-2007-GAL-DOM2]|uniref:HORMA domain-containing protein n=4 Tax=Toxoplasma gondii TaxID=5811 RepID=S7UEP3_TOXGG|nr:hypothetical protein TGGT1_244010 [Toxoplasma gondii GT1]KAF4643182.1 hypothetical protein TGRH88_028490 [Toxoplasma gondii]KFG33149.1 HORMA domain protein [Toxoplasma gondii GAB2-2007-GAL-DOM2]KFG51491.1 HORMA domain protein [Toxoplasma gondii FOU]